LTQAVVAFNRAGNNQNQIARALNEFLLVAHEQSSARLASEIEARLAAIDEITAAIKAALNRGGSDDPDPASGAGCDP
jgi:Bacterial mobilisation protein (MobC)